MGFLIPKRWKLGRGPAGGGMDGHERRAPADEDFVFVAPPEPPRIGAALEAADDLMLPAAPGPRPAVAADGGRAGDLDVFAAAVAGRDHAASGDPREDAFALMPRGSSVFCALADGVGRASHGGLGATAASASAVHQLADFAAGGHDVADALASAVEAATVDVRRAADASGLGGHDLATTLMLAAAQPAGNGVHAVLTSVGDSSAFVASDGVFEPLIGPGLSDEGRPLDEYVPFETGRAIQSVVAQVPAPGLLVLATDGLAADLRSSPAVREWCWNRWLQAESPLEAAWALAYRRQGTFDDLGFIVVRRSRSA
jgi:hypothetical protein